MNATETEELGCRMTCAQAIEFLRAYLDGELAADMVAIFEAHLTICEDCRNYLDSYRTTLAAVVEVKSTEPAIEGAAEIPQTLLDAILAAKGGP